MLSVLFLAAHHGRLVLIIGLVIGILIPSLAVALKPWLGVMVAILLFIGALRVGPEEILGKFRDIRPLFGVIAVYQVALPCLLIWIFWFIDFTGPTASALILMAAASAISGSPNLTLLTGNDPASALRVLILGTALLPVTVFPVFSLASGFGGTSIVALTSLKLLGIILGSTGLAFLCRYYFLRNPSTEKLKAIDGLSAIVMAVVVVGLMSGIAPAFEDSKLLLLTTLGVVFVANFGLQIVAWFALGAAGLNNGRTGYAICAGNRNMALFLAALPAAITDPLLLYIACYQIPMYLTPLMLKWLYKEH